MIICECGEIICDRGLFKDYIKTSVNPSTPTIGHKKCGHIFNFIDGKRPKKYSSRTQLKSLAMDFAQKNKLNSWSEKYLLEVDRLKSGGNLSDSEILVMAFQKLINE